MLYLWERMNGEARADSDESPFMCVHLNGAFECEDCVSLAAAQFSVTAACGESEFDSDT